MENKYDGPYLTTNEMIDLYDVTRRTLGILVRKGLLTRYFKNGNIAYCEKEYLRILDRNTKYLTARG